jgi:hypothetical protein
MVPRKRASGDRTDQLPDTRRLHRNSVVGSTGRRIPTHSRNFINTCRPTVRPLRVFL